MTPAEIGEALAVPCSCGAAPGEACRAHRYQPGDVKHHSRTWDLARGESKGMPAPKAPEGYYVRAGLSPMPEDEPGPRVLAFTALESEAISGCEDCIERGRDGFNVGEGDRVRYCKSVDCDGWEVLLSGGRLVYVSSCCAYAVFRQLRALQLRGRILEQMRRQPAFILPEDAERELREVLGEDHDEGDPFVEARRHDETPLLLMHDSLRLLFDAWSDLQEAVTGREFEPADPELPDTMSKTRDEMRLLLKKFEPLLRRIG